MTDTTPDTDTDPYRTWSDEEIDEEKIKQDVLGTHTFEGPIYHQNQMVNNAIEGYREGEDPRFPPVDVIEILVEQENKTKNKQNVALIPSTEQMETWMEEVQNGERNHCPAVVFEQFYCERVVGSKSLSKAYELVINEADSIGETAYSYEWDVDYYNWEVTITVTETEE